MTHAFKKAKLMSDPDLPVLLKPPAIDFMQSLVLKQLDLLGPEKACGYHVLKDLSLQHGVWLNTPQVYRSIRELEARKLIERIATKPQPGYKPGTSVNVSYYGVTEVGREELKLAAEHYSAVAVELKKVAA